MAYFAEIDEQGIVKRVIVAGQEFIDSGAVGDPKNWVETFMDGDVRKNYAGVGHKYHKDIDAFVPSKSYASWILDEATTQYNAPKETPKDGKKYTWDESKTDWVVREK